MKKKFYILLFVILGFTCFSCSNFLTEHSQDQAYIRTYTDLDELLVGDVYMPCDYVSFGYSSTKWEAFYPYVHFMGDETQIVIGSATSSVVAVTAPYYLFGYYTWQLDVERDYEGVNVWTEVQDWEKLYNYINISNLVISLIDERPAETDADCQNVSRIKGEAYFLRAAYYFVLVNLYGKPYSLETASTDLAVPLKLDPYIVDKIFERATVERIYQQIVDDLLEAESCLKDIPRKSVFRANHTATCLLLSRVYLYMQNYEETLKWAKACIEEQSALEDLNNFAGGDFLTEDSPELIFTMGSNHLPLNIYNENGYHYPGMFMVSEDLYKCYWANDLRAQYFVAFNNGLYTYEKAHYASGTTLQVSDNFAFRTAEAYLNLAESAACLGSAYVAEALEAYNTLRRNRIAGYQDESGMSGKALVDSIRLERRRELCLEGHRWFDLRRYMVNDLYPDEKTLTNDFICYERNTSTYLYEPVVYRRYTLPPHDGAWTLPIPQEELNANPGMPDNERGVRDYVSLLN